MCASIPPESKPWANLAQDTKNCEQLGEDVPNSNAFIMNLPKRNAWTSFTYKPTNTLCTTPEQSRHILLCDEPWKMQKNTSVLNHSGSRSNRQMQTRALFLKPDCFNFASILATCCKTNSLAWVRSLSAPNLSEYSSSERETRANYSEATETDLKQRLCAIFTLIIASLRIPLVCKWRRHAIPTESNLPDTIQIPTDNSEHSFSSEFDEELSSPSPPSRELWAHTNGSLFLVANLPSGLKEVAGNTEDLSPSWSASDSESWHGQGYGTSKRSAWLNVTCRLPRSISKLPKNEHYSCPLTSCRIRHQLVQT